MASLRALFASGGNRSHWVDRAYVRLTREGSFFEDGWGGHARVARLATSPFAAEIPSPRIVWGRARTRGDWVERDGELESPMAAELPIESRVAHVRWMVPTAQKTRAVAVLLGATGDVGYARRTRWAAPLMRAGVAAILLENPYYGVRRPAAQRDVEVRTVADLLLLGRAAVEEARALAVWLRGQGHAVALSGYSMGGQLSAMAAAMSPFPVAVVPVAAPCSATAVFVDGLLSRATAWSALSDVDASSPSAALATQLDAISLDRLPRPACPSAAILVGATRDGYVAKASVEALHRHWPGSELRWIDEGHVTGYVRSGAVVRAALLEALGRLRGAEG